MKKWKQENRFIESQRGALNKYFPATSSVDVNIDTQRQKANSGQDDEHHTNAYHKVSKYNLWVVSN
jgi:hypothetical protein